MGFLCFSFTNANGCTARQKLATHSRVVLVIVCIMETRLTVVLDLMQTLAFQTLKFCKSLTQSNNTTLYNTFMCFSKERDYLVLLRTYSCTTTDSIGVEKSQVLEDYSSPVVKVRGARVGSAPPLLRLWRSLAREVTDLLTALCYLVCVCV